MEKLKLFFLALAASATMLACENKKQEGGNEGSGVAQGMEDATEGAKEGLNEAGEAVSDAVGGAENDAKGIAKKANENAVSVLGEDQVEFMVDAADDGMFELETSRLAAEKATSKEVKEFANKMVAEHSKTNEELKSLAQKKNVTVPASLSSYNTDKLEKLRKLSGQEFDKEYMDIMVTAHNKDVNKFEDKTDDIKDAELKAFVVKTLPTLKHHFEMAQKTQYQVENSANANQKSKGNM